ncbi:unnamed protein product [Ambrosiozyma monospora]|uniref:Unnamed protein product n=1 Tax=Ambrosiozyma monospora TaxID=43982 RepID=A0A9W6T9P7_AMBMO|nr:unnamed protein product [Ambrosiozyma monospora]
MLLMLVELELELELELDVETEDELGLELLDCEDDPESDTVLLESVSSIAEAVVATVAVFETEAVDCL